MLNKVYIGVGTNLGDKPKNIEEAYSLVENSVGKIRTKSSLYSSEPWGFESNEDFINSMIIVESKHAYREVLARLKMIEDKMGRVKMKTDEYESRIIDLDIIAFNDEIVDENEIIIPHQHLQDRKFVLVPMNEVDNEWVHPVSRLSISELIIHSKDDSNVFKIT